jgi:ABC-2 type transport system permease protein
VVLLTAAVLPAYRPVVGRTSGGSLPAQVGLEVRKSLSTRSGVALVATAVLIAPAAMAIAAASSTEHLDSATGPVVVTGMLSVLVLIALGVLSTAGEWTHGSVQTTYLLEPRRSRVLAAKALAVAAVGATVAALAATLAFGVLALLEPSMSFDGVVRAVLVVGVGGAAFALIGAGVGAALGNTPGALTGVYLVNLGVLPLLQTFKPALADNIDPGNAVLNLAMGDEQAQSIVILAVWVAVALVAGAVMTRRRAVQ